MARSSAVQDRLRRTVKELTETRLPSPGFDAALNSLHHRLILFDSDVVGAATTILQGGRPPASWLMSDRQLASEIERLAANGVPEATSYRDRMERLDELLHVCELALDIRYGL
jgi:hypothetical protein